MQNTKGQLLLAADIGGTNARLQLWTQNAVELRCARQYHTAAYASIVSLLQQFLRDAAVADSDCISIASIAICCPVEDEARICGPGGVSWPQNVASDVERSFTGILRCVLLNDFVAVGLGVKSLHPNQTQILHDAPLRAQSTCVCLGPGTGLGTCFMTWDSTSEGYVAHPAEGGQPEFAARTAEEWQLKQFLSADGRKQVIVEDVISGPGLANCFRFACSNAGFTSALADTTPQEDLPAAVASLALGTDKASTPEHVVATSALELWLGAFLGELRAVALRFLPMGGLYIAGGVPSKLMPWFGQSVASRFAIGDEINRDILSTVPVLLVNDDADPGLTGARVRAIRAASDLQISSKPDNM